MERKKQKKQAEIMLKQAEKIKNPAKFFFLTVGKKTNTGRIMWKRAEINGNGLKKNRKLV